MKNNYFGDGIDGEITFTECEANIGCSEYSNTQISCSYFKESPAVTMERIYVSILFRKAVGKITDKQFNSMLNEAEVKLNCKNYHKYTPNSDFYKLVEKSKSTGEIPPFLF